jgi:methylenetetrahydrofolate--tRNA-(uracil-5-)-methyltransferase
MTAPIQDIHIIGAGLAGSEAALQLAKRGHRVKLYEMKPLTKSPAHHSEHFAEIVCSNSLGSQNTEEDVTASGLLKDELSRLDCELLKIARQVALPAGKALAVDRERFAQLVTEAVQAQPNIEIMAQTVDCIPPEGLVLIATGPMTAPGLVTAISELLQEDQLYFFDAASPIIARDSINFDIAFYQDRYDADRSGATEAERPSQQGSYINCPLEKPHYEALLEILVHGEKTELKSFEKESASYFESCLPVEVLASRGPQTLRFGPMKPVGLQDPRAERRPYAVVQLRQDNAEGTLYNMVGFQTNLKWGAQKEMIRLIPGLENAEVVRYGVMHRNTFINSPKVLQPTLQLREHPRVFFAGQLTGTEGYTESIATGLFAALNIARLAEGLEPVTLPRENMLGALLHYITRPEATKQTFQPINSNWGILPELPEGSFKRKDKKARNRLYRERAAQSLDTWLLQHPETCKSAAASLH